MLYRNTQNFRPALHHSDQTIYYAKMMKEGEAKTTWVCDTLIFKSNTFYQMAKFAEAKAAAEEAYCYISAVYDPEHPLVLKAGGKLIEILPQLKDHYDGERYARILYESLTRTAQDPESYEIARAATCMC
jgi:hypothetical protein